MIAAAVRAERARRGWTQAELAERLGWPASSLGDLERGTRKVAADDIPDFCRVFDIPFARLVMDADPGDLSPLRLS